jgi:hypothetical protein
MLRRVRPRVAEPDLERLLGGDDVDDVDDVGVAGIVDRPDAADRESTYAMLCRGFVRRRHRLLLKARPWSSAHYR